MKMFFGELHSGRGAFAIERETRRDRRGETTRVDVQWWPFRRIFGIGGRRFILALVVTDAPASRVLEL